MPLELRFMYQYISIIIICWKVEHCLVIIIQGIMFSKMRVGGCVLSFMFQIKHYYLQININFLLPMTIFEHFEKAESLENIHLENIFNS